MQNLPTVIAHILEKNNEHFDIVIPENTDSTLRIEHNSAHEHQTIYYRIVVKKGAHVKILYQALNFNSAHISFEILLSEPRSSVELSGLYVLDATQKLVIQTRQLHHVAHTHSNIMLKGILADQSVVSYNGTIVIEQSAKDSDAQQYNKNIVLNKKSCVHSVPSLEVKNNEVSCKHGTAIGYLNADHIFYLQTRGIPTRIIKQLLLHAFYSDLFFSSLHKEEILQKIIKIAK